MNKKTGDDVFSTIDRDDRVDFSLSRLIRG